MIAPEFLRRRPADEVETETLKQIRAEGAVSMIEYGVHDLIHLDRIDALRGMHERIGRLLSAIEPETPTWWRRIDAAMPWSLIEGCCLAAAVLSVVWLLSVLIGG